MKFLDADTRLAEKSGTKILIVGLCSSTLRPAISRSQTFQSQACGRAHGAIVAISLVPWAVLIQLCRQLPPIAKRITPR